MNVFGIVVSAALSEETYWFLLERNTDFCSNSGVYSFDCKHSEIGEKNLWTK